MITNTLLPIIKRIYIKLGGDAQDVSNMSTIAPVLNLIVGLIKIPKEHYSDFDDVPFINDEVLLGNKTSEDLKIHGATYFETDDSIVPVTSLNNGVYFSGNAFNLVVGSETIRVQKGAVFTVENITDGSTGCIIGDSDYGVVTYRYVQGFSPVIKKLKDMATETQVNAKQNALTAGTGISIVNDVISATLGISFEVVQTLPQSGNNQTIYLVPNSGSAPNIHDEYIWVNSDWEKIGTTEIDLSGYVTSEALATILADYYTKTQVDTELAKKIERKNVNALPTSDIDNNVLYVVSNGNIYTNLFENGVENVPCTLKGLSTYQQTNHNSSVTLVNNNWRFFVHDANIGLGIRTYRETNSKVDLTNIDRIEFNFPELTITGEATFRIWIYDSSKNQSIDSPAKYLKLVPSDSGTNLVKYIETTEMSGEYTIAYGMTTWSGTSWSDWANGDVTAIVEKISLVETSSETRVFMRNGTSWLDVTGLAENQVQALINSSISGKANTADVNTALAGKIDTSAIKQSTGNSTTDILSQQAVDVNYAKKPLIFKNISVAANDWVDNTTTPDTGFEDFDYKVVLTCPEVTENMLAEIVFTSPQNDVSTVGKSGSGTVTVYSNSSNAVNIPVLFAGAPVAVQVNSGSGNAEVIYSPDERQIGWYEYYDNNVKYRKPLYEKTIQTTHQSTDAADYRITGQFELFPAQSGVQLIEGHACVTSNAARLSGTNGNNMYSAVYQGIDTQRIIANYRIYYDSSKPNYSTVSVSARVRYTKTTDTAEVVS